MFQLSLCFTSAKCVSSLSAKSLDHGAQEFCVCVLVTILDHLLMMSLFNIAIPFSLSFLVRRGKRLFCALAQFGQNPTAQLKLGEVK
jgi:hypothetical protein